MAATVTWSVDFLATAPPEESTSGLSRVVWELSVRLARRGDRVRVLYPSPETPGPTEPYHGVGRVEVPLVGVSRRPFGRDIAIGRNASALIDPKADLIVGNDEKAGALRLPYGSRAVYGYFVHDVALHTFDTLRPGSDGSVRQTFGNVVDRMALRRLEGRAISRARRVLVASELNRSLLTQYYRTPSERISVLPAGVPDPLEVGPRDACRLALKIPTDVPVVSYIGRTPERQGLDLALEAFRRVRSIFPGSRCLVVGSTPPTEPGVMALGVAEETTKAQVLRASDVFLFPSRYEGFGLAPREAMRYGVATIVSGHVPMEGIEAGRAVRVVTADDAQEYARELAELFADPVLRRTMGEAGKRWADQFTFDRMADLFEEAFRPYLEATGRPGPVGHSGSGALPG